MRDMINAALATIVIILLLIVGNALHLEPVVRLSGGIVRMLATPTSGLPAEENPSLDLPATPTSSMQLRVDFIGYGKERDGDAVIVNFRVTNDGSLPVPVSLGLFSLVSSSNSSPYLPIDASASTTLDPGEATDVQISLPADVRGQSFVLHMNVPGAPVELQLPEVPGPGLM